MWEDAERIVFGGGSVKRMRGDGASLETLVADGGARLPAAGGDGELAYVAPDGTVHLVGEGQVLAVPVESRPALSPDGLWVAGARAGDGQLMIAPLDEDDAPPLPVPGVSGVLDPVFRPTGDAGGPPPVVVERISPEKPIPGEEAEIRGSGFDWILPANTRVFFAGPEAELEADVLDVEPDRVTVVVPQEIVAGDVRVTTFGAAGTLPVVPATGGLVVLARAPWGAGVPGLTVVVTDPAAGGAAPEGAGAGAAASQIASGTTDASGRAVFEDLRPGLYQVQITPQDGFRVSDPGPREVRVRDDQESVTFTVQPLARGLSTIPGRLLVVVGERLDVELRPVDANGNVIPQANDVVWNSRLGHFSVGPQELEGYIEGAHPTPVEEGDTLVVTLDDRTFLLPVTVTSFIEGTITRDDGGQAQPQPGAGGPPAGIPAETFPPAAGVTVLLEKPAGTEVARATTGAAGRYRFDRLLAGTYRVRPLELDGLSPAPAFQDVTLGIESETGSADFTMSAGTVASVTVSGGGTIQALGATLSLTAVARDSANNVLGSRTTTWTSSDPSVATVDASGTVTAVDNGSAVITATVEGVSGSTSVIVDQLAVSITIQNVPPEGFATGFIGDSRQITAIAKDANGFDVTDAVPSWTSSAPSVASVSSTGMWNALAPGQAVITASMDGVSDALTTFVLQVLAGTLTITNQTDLDNAAAQFYGRITGDLNVNFTPLADLDGLDFLETVEGTVSIQGNGSLLDLDALARLDSIGGDLTVFDNDLLDPPFGSSASLRAVGGSVLIDDNDGLRNLDLFGNVQVIGGDLTIRFNSALENLDGLTSLTQIGGDLIVEFNAISSLNNLPALRQVEGGVSLDDPGTVFGMPALEVVVQNGLSLGGVSGGLITETLDFPALACIGGQLQIYNNSVLTDAHFPSLTEIRFVCPPVLPLIGFSSTPPPPDLVIEMNVALGTLDLDALARVEGEVIFESNGLTTFDLPSLTDVTGSFRVSDDAFLDSFSAAALTQIGGGLVIRNNSALTSFDLSSLMSVNGSCFCAPPAPSDGGPSGAPLPPPNSFSEAEIRNNTSLATWDMTALDEVDQLIIDGNTSLVTIPAMPNLGTGTPSIVIHVTDNTLLTSLAGFSGLGTASLLNIQNNPILGSLAGLESLTQVGQLALNQNGLVSVKLPNLTTVDRALQIQNEALLSSVSFPSLALIGAGSGVSPSDGIISLFNLPALTALSLPSLTEVDSQIHVQATGLADLDAFTGVQSGLASVLVTGNGSLTDVTGLANLGLAIAGDPIVTGNFTITINPALCGSDAAALVATLESHHPGSPAIAGSIDTTTGNQLCGGED
ncbi:MAG: hypothetical protein D6701_09625 [Gemmatimonadetes bacterium]|nr:MAG: hypothetical protein D6701_09625 [Gemmatimonadota bacterium]